MIDGLPELSDFKITITFDKQKNRFIATLENGISVSAHTYKQAAKIAATRWMGYVAKTASKNPRKWSMQLPINAHLHKMRLQICGFKFRRKSIKTERQA